jgi:hypothetical protein
VSREFVVLARMQLSQQLIDHLPDLGEFRDESLPVHYREITRYVSHRNRLTASDSLTANCCQYRDRVGATPCILMQCYCQLTANKITFFAVFDAFCFILMHRGAYGKTTVIRLFTVTCIVFKRATLTGFEPVLPP